MRVAAGTPDASRTQRSHAKNAKLANETTLCENRIQPLSAFSPRTMWSLSNAFTAAFKFNERDSIPQFEPTARPGLYLERVLGS